MYHTSLILVIVCFAQDDAIVSWICCWLVSSTVSFVTSPAHHPISVFFFFLEAALLSGFAFSLSSIALMHLVRLSVSESQLSHFWITEPSRVCAFYLKPHLHRSSSLTFSLTFFFFFSWDNGSYSQKASYSKPSPHPSPCSYEWRRKIMISEKGSRSIILCASVFMHHWLTLERAEVSTPLRTPSTV